MTDFYEKNKKPIHNILILFAVILCSYLFFHYIFRFIAPFFIGWILSLIFNPFVTFLNEKCKFPRWLGSILAIILLIAFFSSVVAGIVAKLSYEASLFYESLPQYIESIQEVIEKMIDFFDNAVNLLPPAVQTHIGNASSNVSLFDLLASLLKSGPSFGAVMAIPNVFMILIVAFISSYFFTKDKQEIADFTAKHLPISFVENFRLIKKDLLSSIAGYFKTQFILMFYTFTICIIGLFILKSPYTLLLSVVISLIDSLPFFGSGFILWPGAVIFLATGETKLAVGYIILYLCINLMRQIMQPKILGTQIGLPPLITLISMYIGLKCLGVLGMIIGPLIAVLVKAVYTIKKEKAAEFEALKQSLYGKKDS